MKKHLKSFLALAICLICLAPSLGLASSAAAWRWFCPECAMYVFGNYCYNCGCARTSIIPPAVDAGVYDIGVPQLGSTRFGPNSHNLYVLWVQLQMKATGLYYQGEEWDETGVLGDHTRQEIARMMADRGYIGHDGYVDQQVVSVLTHILGRNLQPVYAGGYYDKMHTLTSGTTFGSMRYVRNDTGTYTRGTEWVQRCLSKLGYYHSVIDGEFGDITIEAVKAFQRDHHFQQRPYVSMGVARCMLEECVRRGFDISDLP